MSEQDSISAVFAKCRLRARWRDLVHVLEHGLDRSPSFDQRMRRLLTDALHTRNVVDFVAGDGQNFTDLLRGHTEIIDDVFSAHDFVVVTCFQGKKLHMIAHQLHKIFVGGDNKNITLH